MSRSLEDLFRGYRELGKPSLLGEVYDETSGDLLGIALHITRDHAQAEDLVQSTFLIALERHRDWDGKQPLIEWLIEVMVDIMPDGSDTSPTDQAITGAEDALHKQLANEGNPVSAALALELDRSLEACLERMPERYQAVLSLRIKKGMDSSEIAAALDRPHATVRSQLARGLDRLRSALPPAALLLWSSPETQADPLRRIRDEVLSNSPVRTTGTLSLSWVPIALIPVIAGALLWGTQLWRKSQAEIAPHSVQAHALESRLDPIQTEQDSNTPAEPRTRTPLGPATPKVNSAPFESRVLGSVLDQTGQGLPGVKLTLFRWGSWNPSHEPPPIAADTSRKGYQTHSDANGNYELQIHLPASEEVILEADGGEYFTSEMLWFGNPYEALQPLKKGDNEVPSLRLVHGSVLGGQVLQSDGAPLALSQVTLSPGQNLENGSMLSTDADGRFRVANLHPGYQQINFSKGLFIHHAPLMSLEVGREHTNRLWHVPQGQTVCIQVTDPHGAPVPNATVFGLYDFSPSTRLQTEKATDANGVVSVEVVPNSRLTLSTQCPQGRIAEMRVEIGDSTQSIQIPLPDLTKRWIRILDAKTNKLCSRAKLRVYRDPDGNNETRLIWRYLGKPTGEQGWFVFGAPGDRLEIEVDGYANHSVALPHDGNSLECFVTPLPKLTGRIVDGDGVPQKGYQLELVSSYTTHEPVDPLLRVGAMVSTPCPTVVRWTTTDSAGEFAFQADRYGYPHHRLTAEAQDGHGASLGFTWAGAEPHALGEVIAVPSGRIDGQLLLPDGVFGVGLSVSLHHSKSAMRAVVDRNNRFRFDQVPPGEWHLRLGNSSELFGAGFGQWVTVVSGERSPVTLDAQHLGRAWPAVFVRGADGQPESGVALALVAPDWNGSVPPPEFALGRTSDGGQASRRVLLTGPAHVLYKRADDLDWQRHPSAKIRLLPGSCGPFTVRLP